MCTAKCWKPWQHFKNTQALQLDSSNSIAQVTTVDATLCRKFPAKPACMFHLYIYIYTYIYIYKHTYIHTYILTYIHIYNIVIKYNIYIYIPKPTISSESVGVESGLLARHFESRGGKAFGSLVGHWPPSTQLADAGKFGLLPLSRFFLNEMAEL